MDVFDASGRWVKSLATNRQMLAGQNQDELDLTTLQKGAYYLRLRTVKGYASAQMLKL